MKNNLQMQELKNRILYLVYLIWQWIRENEPQKITDLVEPYCSHLSIKREGLFLKFKFDRQHPKMEGMDDLGRYKLRVHADDWARGKWIKVYDWISKGACAEVEKTEGQDRERLRGRNLRRIYNVLMKIAKEKGIDMDQISWPIPKK